ncbi:hypothetical protein ABT275_42560 [Streptomyces sp. NPDC001185]|uniref:hypothetical protein n=1 Tax=Streptomyces sp. NPDC001185 TaxID=3154380 RepID=UPI003321A561
MKSSTGEHHATPSRYRPVHHQDHGVDRPLPRLLPAERIDPALLPDSDHQQDATARKGRRILGRGTMQA